MLPAYAGMILPGAGGPGRLGCAPRVCGDDPALQNLRRAWIKCSPRMRG